LSDCLCRGRGAKTLFSRISGHDKSAAMKKPATHRAYCVLREGRRTGRWMECGFASAADGVGDLQVYLETVPVTGFDGHILLRPMNAKSDEPFPPDPEPEGADEMPDDADFSALH
jgi:hypothetical protein